METRDIKHIRLSDTEPRQTACGGRGWCTQDGDCAAIFEYHYEDEDECPIDRSHGFGYCFYGVAGGLAYEGEDVLGFASVEDAEAAAREFYLAAQKGGAK